MRTLSRRVDVNLAAGQTVTVTVKPTSAMLRRIRREKRLPGLLSVKATDAAGNVSTRTKSLSFR
jgi:hypothetical protein